MDDAEKYFKMIGQDIAVYKAGKAGKAVLENAFNSSIPVEGTVEKEIKGSYEIKIGDTISV